MLEKPDEARTAAVMLAPVRRRRSWTTCDVWLIWAIAVLSCVTEAATLRSSASSCVSLSRTSCRRCNHLLALACRACVLTHTSNRRGAVFALSGEGELAVPWCAYIRLANSALTASMLAMLRSAWLSTPQEHKRYDHGAERPLYHFGSVAHCPNP